MGHLRQESGPTSIYWSPKMQKIMFHNVSWFMICHSSYHPSLMALNHGSKPLCCSVFCAILALSQNNKPGQVDLLITSERGKKQTRCIWMYLVDEPMDFPATKSDSMAAMWDQRSLPWRHGPSLASFNKVSISASMPAAISRARTWPADQSPCGNVFVKFRQMGSFSEKVWGTKKLFETWNHYST